MKPLLRGWLPLCLALSFLLAAVRPAPAQNAIGQRPGGNNLGQPGGNNFGQPGGNNLGQQNPFGGPAGGNAAAAAAASSVSTGMIVAGIGLILAGLALTGGVVYMAMQGQKSSYGGGGRRKKRPRRDDDD